MITVSKEVEFDTGHRVPNHNSKCKNLHGHRYKVRAVVTGYLIREVGASDEGMLIDFGDLKKILTEEVHDVLDHGFMVYDGDDELWERLEPLIDKYKFINFPTIPTVENLAVWCWEHLDKAIINHWRGNVLLHEVVVWETPTSVATYRREDA